MFARRRGRPRARGGARRRRPRHRRRHERGRSRAARLDRGRALRRRRRRRAELRRPAADQGARRQPTSRSRTRRALLLLAPIRLVRLCRPHLEASGHGRVIAITSSAVKEPVDNLALSSGVRPGLVGWLKVAARELGPAGVTVNCVAPGRIDTERIREVYPDGPTRGRPRHDPAAAPRHAPRGGRRRLLPRLRSRRLRLRHDDRGRRRPDAEPAVKPLRLVSPGRRARS